MMKKHVLILLLISFLIGVWGSVSVYNAKSRNYEVLTVNYFNDKGEQVEGVLYKPRSGALPQDETGITGSVRQKKYPAMISLHYGLQNREALQPASMLMAKRGIAVLDVIISRSSVGKGNRDFADYTADASGAVKFLYTLPFVDKSAIYISGHSIGGNLASITGSNNKKVKGVIAVGYPVSFEPGAPQHLLMTAGIYDELHNQAKMLAAFGETADSTANRGFFDNIGRMGSSVKPGVKTRFYYQSYLSDHYIEPTDANIAEASAVFINSIEQRNAACPGISPFISFYAGIGSRVLIFLTVVLIYLLGFISLMAGSSDNKSVVVGFMKNRINVLIFLTLFLILAFAHKPAEHLTDITVLSAVFVAFVIAGFWGCKMKKPDWKDKDGNYLIGCFFKDMLKTVKFFIAFYFSYIAGLFIHAGISPYLKAESALGTITGVLYLIPVQFYVFITRINGLFLNADWTFRVFSPVVVIIVVVETVKPGFTCLLIEQFFSKLISAMENLDFRIKFQAGVPGIILMIILFGICAVLWKQIMAEGYALGSAEMLGFIHLFFSFVIAPAVISTLIIRKIKRLSQKPPS